MRKFFLGNSLREQYDLVSFFFFQAVVIWEVFSINTLRFSSALVSNLHFCDTLNDMSHHSSARVCLTDFIRKSLQSFIPDSFGKWWVGQFSVRTQQ